MVSVGTGLRLGGRWRSGDGSDGTELMEAT